MRSTPRGHAFPEMDRDRAARYGGFRNDIGKTDVTMRRTLSMLAIVCAETAAQAQQAQVQAEAPSVFCYALSDSPRGRGLIVSPVFEPRLRTSLPWLQQAFIGFLRTTYAPYGNNWVFRDDGARCTSFAERPQADKERDALILQEQRIGENVYYVTFVGP